MDKLYLYLNIFTFSLPFLLSFDKKVAFYKEWKYLFPAIGIMATVFIGWDAIFTYYNIWSFNDTYLTGPRLLGLPIEEWMFFFTVPYACVFIYACLKAYLNIDPLQKFHKAFYLTLALVLLGIAAFNFTKAYTAITFAATAILVLYNVWKRQAWLSMFLLSYFITLIPFVLVNGILTGSHIEDQVVWYNPDHILNIRVFTIPIEDSIYNLMMLLMTVQFFEYFKDKWKVNKTH